MGAVFVELPPAVQRTIRAQAGAAELTEVNRFRLSGAEVYEVTFRSWGMLPPLYVASDGSVLNPDFTVAVGAADIPQAIQTGAEAGNVPIEKLPEAVMQQLVKIAPSTAISNISRQLWGNQEVYIVSFPESSNQPRLYLSADGTVLAAPVQYAP